MFLGPKANADINIEIPKNCFQKNNEANQSYQRKRTLCLVYITSCLIRNDLKSIAEVNRSGKLSKYENVLSTHHNPFIL